MIDTVQINVANSGRYDLSDMNNISGYSVYSLFAGLSLLPSHIETQLYTCSDVGVHEVVLLQRITSCLSTPIHNFTVVMYAFVEC